ncbi:hypothetical protein ACT4US_33875 [Bacillus sp. HC-Mk]
MKEVLDELHKKGYGIAVISSNSEEHIRAFLQWYIKLFTSLWHR